jgi:LDH2 family malate/lactate/ureidoglycolate dehydrogenase
MLGTNPMAIAFPAGEEPAVVIDMATSAVAYGKIEIALRKNETVPRGWIVDKEGRDTVNPCDMIDGGAQLPLGSDREMGGHKGYCLASMVDILCCVLSGANWGPFAPPFALRQEIPTRSVGKGIGHFFGALEIDGFIDKNEFKKQMDQWIRIFRNTKPAAGTKGPLIPGDPEREAEAIRSKEGIPLLRSVVDDLLDIAKQTGVPFKAP